MRKVWVAKSQCTVLGDTVHLHLPIKFWFNDFPNNPTLYHSSSFLYTCGTTRRWQQLPADTCRIDCDA